jgi:hypothetical protein
VFEFTSSSHPPARIEFTSSSPHLFVQPSACILGLFIVVHRVHWVD